MANVSDTTIPDNKYLLVSDSNEVGNQYDSKKLSQRELVDMAQGNLFKKCLDMSRYLSKSQLDSYNEFVKIPEINLSEFQPGKLRVQDGQVILLDAANIPSGYSPYEWLKEIWHVPVNFTVTQIGNCMLRGVTFIDERFSPNVDSSIPVKRVDNERIGLGSENVPSHMHHSAVTTGSSMEGMSSGTTPSQTVKGGSRHDVFNNDRMTGLDKNELDGVVDQFLVEEEGIDVSSASGSPVVMHNNLPNYREFYMFLVLGQD